MVNLAIKPIMHFIARFSLRDLVLISLALHLFVIPFPNDGGKVFDESYYVPASLDLIQGKASNLEHPFLGKAWTALSILAFGNTWFAWRIPAVIFGLLTVIVFYRLARLFLDERQSLTAAAFLSFDNIFFTHSSLFLLEVPALFFGILGFYLYFKKQFVWSAVALAVSTLSKEWGIIFLLAIAIYHTSHYRVLNSSNLRMAGKFLFIYFTVFSLALWAYDYAYKPTGDTIVVLQPTVVKDQYGNVITTTTLTTTKSEPITNPIDHIRQIVKYQTSLVLSGTADAWNNYPWGWVNPFIVNPPIYFQTTVTKNITYVSAGQVVGFVTKTIHPITWTGIGNLFIWSSIWIVAPFSIFRIAKRRSSSVDYLLLAWIGGTYLPWFYVSLVVHRIVYAFYFINTVPALCLGIPHLARSVAPSSRIEKIILAAWLVLVVGFFFSYFPVNIFER
jgi:dolichyl-phosphate-mannose--protein O-mannosyl transferase